VIEEIGSELEEIGSEFDRIRIRSKINLIIKIKEGRDLKSDYGSEWRMNIEYKN